MTQTAETPIQLTYDKLHEKFKSNFPTLLAPLEQTKGKLERGEGAQDLANIISCEVARSEEATAFVYTWTGQKGQVFECRVLKPFDPTPVRKPEAAQESPEPSWEPSKPNCTGKTRRSSASSARLSACSPFGPRRTQLQQSISTFPVSATATCLALRC